MLTKGDDFPIHQTSEPIAYSGTDRNFYDRYFFNGYAPAGEGDQDVFFSVAFGVYPHLNICDASFCLIRDGVETALHASRHLNMERMDTHAGPIAIEVDAPLEKLTVRVNDTERGVKAEIHFTGRAFPIEEPRFIRRMGPRAFMDYTRLTQNGRYTGWIEVDGKRSSVDGFVGTRDRSWGIRSVGARDPQPVVPQQPGQFFWIWSPCNFKTGSFFFHTNDDGNGLPWNRRAVYSKDGATAEEHFEIEDCSIDIDWKSGTRHAKSATVDLGKHGKVVFEPQYTFFMMGLGYTHPKWGHGNYQGELAVEREDFKIAEADVHQMHHLHIQEIVKATHHQPDGQLDVGRGVLEQLVIGPHKPSGFTGMLDFAK